MSNLSLAMTVRASRSLNTFGLNPSLRSAQQLFVENRYATVTPQRSSILLLMTFCNSDIHFEVFSV